MKTIEAFIKEIEGSKALQEEIAAIKDKDAVAEFLKKYDVDGTAGDFAKALKALAGAEGELSDEAAEAVAGGGWLGKIFADAWAFWGIEDYVAPLIELFGTTLPDAFKGGSTVNDGPSAQCGQFSTQATKYKVKGTL